MTLLHLRILLVVVALVVVAAAAPRARAQDDRLVPVGDWAYEYVQRLQRRGYLLELNPIALPYTQGELAVALERVPRRRLRGAERHWLKMLAERFVRPPAGRGRTAIGGWLEAGSAASNNDRLDPLRYAETGDPLIEAGDARIYPNAALQIYMDHGPVVAQLGLRHDVFYDVDPDGLDAVNRLYVRNEGAYVGLNTRFASFYLGRFGTHWAPIGVPGVLLSDNPRSFDQAQLRLGGDRLALRSLLGELDAANADGTFTGRVADDPDAIGINRYLSAHRLDWRPWKSVAFSLSESVLYSGAGASPSLKFASPVHTFLFLVDNRPKNEEHNGFFAASVWAHRQPVTGSAQVLLDDFDFINAAEPASIAAVGELAVNVRPWLDLGAATHVVTALTYNTHQPEGRYLYLMRGLASEFSDFVQLGLFADVFPRTIPSLAIAPQLKVLWQGEGDVMDPFPADPSGEETILQGTVERTTRLATRVRYQPDPRFWIAGDFGVNWLQNEGNSPGQESVRFVGLFEFGVRLSLDTHYRLSFRDRRKR